MEPVSGRKGSTGIAEERISDNPHTSGSPIKEAMNGPSDSIKAFRTHLETSSFRWLNASIMSEDLFSSLQAFDMSGRATAAAFRTPQILSLHKSKNIGSYSLR